MKRIYTRRLKAEVTRRRSLNQSNKCVFSCALNCSWLAVQMANCSRLVGRRLQITKKIFRYYMYCDVHIVM